MVYKCGIVGLPNVGKSALFNTITRLNIPSKNFPFCTIEPNIGIVSIPDNRLKKIAVCLSTKNVIHSVITIIDIAGLVKGASKGEGLGNKFLKKIRECNAIMHVVRCFINNEITHVYNNINPLRDIDIINTELLLSDLGLCEKIFQKQSVQKDINDVRHSVFFNLIQRCIYQLKSGFFLKDLVFLKEELKILRQYQFLTLKPMIYIFNMTKDMRCNININELYKDKNVDLSTVIPVVLDHKHSIQTNNIDVLSTQKNRLFFFDVDFNKFIRHLCTSLCLKTFFTAGPKEVRSWTFKAEKTAIQVAKLIHTDFSKGFIRAQIISYIDFIKYRNLIKIKQLGKIRSEGKKYIVQDGDIINFLFNV
ncbi:Ribosome-binding ATPase YchF [Buchnera aphidicola (Cinara pseudotaxifoliae)]|uniref:Ribosome-binding ATPase YchF n=1 Tax=Buchnera aphidicola (Cinara pseudotaxifoliae) TaxID=655384 RepID=A0A451DGM7_9GAMM|nr:redox-regulated ATPase YchF [Buchnera aphidicola]VFP85780.1 Ribosome-binding ATPase YchF [Buchnera aphidicola (Cinara pseudotaxifoliae)]